MPASVAVAIPIRTFSNGPTNSMRGAAYLSGFNKKDPDGKRKSVIVVDVGGTTTDVGVLLPSGFPRKAAAVTYGRHMYAPIVWLLTSISSRWS